MQASGIPAKFPEAFANSAGSSYVRTIPRSQTTTGQASFDTGFPPECFTPANPPSGADFNGILKLFSQWLLWMQAGGTVQYDSAFSANVGGYPSGAILKAASGLGLWQSTTDNNTANPDSGGAGWTAMLPVTLSGNNGFDMPGFSLRSTTISVPAGTTTQTLPLPMPTVITQVAATGASPNIGGTALTNSSGVPNSKTQYQVTNNSGGPAAVAIVAIGQ